MTTPVSRPIQFQQRHAAAFPSEASLRWFLFTKRAELEAAGAVFKQGRRVWIDEQKFFDVLRAVR